MRLVSIAAIAAVSTTVFYAGNGHAQTVLLHDTFDTENNGVGTGVYSGFANFIAADVDLLGSGYFFQLCQGAGGSTPCVDMEGNGNGSLTTRNAYALQPGQLVTVQFDLAGDHRSGGDNTVTASLVSTLGATLFSETFTLPSNAPFTTFTRSFAVTGSSDKSAQLRLASSGRADSYGLLLDNVTLSVSAVPEPAPAALLAAGLGALGWLTTRRRTRG